MKIECIGAGPGNLYFAILVKQLAPKCRVRVFERNPEDHFPGWGIVLDYDVRSKLAAADPPTADAINGNLYHWDTIDVLHRGDCVSSSGHAYGCISRRQLLSILRDRCRELDVEVYDGRPITNPSELDADLIVAGDGIGSAWRKRLEKYLVPQRSRGRNFYLWCGTDHQFAHFTFAFFPTSNGWFWTQAYQYDSQSSTVIAECDERAYRAFGLAYMSADETQEFLQGLFRQLLAGDALHTRAPIESVEWRRFETIRCMHWHWDNVVLLGDAAHTTHYSLGSGAKLALEDAESLARHLVVEEGPIEQRLDAYERERKPKVEAIQKLAERSNRWFDELEYFGQFDTRRLACSLLMRTHFTGELPSVQRIDKMLALAGGGDHVAGTRLKRLLRPLNLSVGK